MQPSLKKRLLTGGSWVIAGKLITATATLVAGSLLGKMLSEADFGVYTTAGRLVWMGTMLGLLGLNPTIVRLIAESRGQGRPGRARGAIQQAYVYGGLGLLVVGLFLFLGGGAWVARSVLESPGLTAIIGLVAVWAVVHGLQVLTSETFRGFQDLRLATVFGGVVTSAVTLVVIASCWFLEVPLTLRQVCLLFLISISASLLLALFFLRRRLATLGPAERLSASEMFSVSVPLWFNLLLSIGMTMSDVLILNAFRSDAEVGIYGGATTLVSLVLMSLMLVNLVVPPFIAELYARGEKARLERMLRLTATVAGLPAMAVLAVYLTFGAQILELAFKPSYREATTVLTLLSVGRLVHVLTGSASQVLSMTGYQTPLMKVTLASAFVTVASALALVGPHGGNGVAAAICSGVVLHSVGAWLMARYHTGMWTHVMLPRARDLRDLFRAEPPPAPPQ